MISLKPVFLWKYLKLTPNRIPKNIGRLFYLSWEDALWDLLRKKNVKKGSVVLVPDIYCGDVEVNIRSHGYNVAHYPVDDKFHTQPGILSKIIIDIKPSVVVVFNYFGVYNSLMKDDSWIVKLPEETILVEDCVHRIANPEKIVFVRRKHFIIDSLRKVMPLQGSVVYAQAADLGFPTPPFYQAIAYSIKVHLLWFLMNFFWATGNMKKAQRLMKRGYDLIGDNLEPAPGFFLFDLLQRFTDVHKIKRIKKAQANYYKSRIKSPVPIPDRDMGELVAFPVFFEPIKAALVKSKMSKAGLPNDFELDDSLWTRNLKILYLPLGPHLTDREIDKIAGIAFDSGFPAAG